jgi:hypothetical protein
MPHTNISGRRSAAGALLILLLACLGLAACGGSSSTTSTGANAAATGTPAGSSSTGSSSTGSSSTGSSSTGTSSTGTSATTPHGRGPARFAAIRECLQKNGVTLPQRTPGSGRPAGGAGLLGGGSGAGGGQLPKGVTRAQYEAALKKCGGGIRFGGNGRFADNPTFKTALAKYAECLRQNGVNVPAPNTSGNGPVFDTKGLNTASPQFKTATMKCRSTLVGAFRRPGGTGGPTPGGAPAGSAGSG